MDTQYISNSRTHSELWVWVVSGEVLRCIEVEVKISSDRACRCDGILFLRPNERSFKHMVK